MSEWQPVEELEYTPGDEYLILRNGVIGTGYIDMDFDYSPVTVVLPDGIRLCRLVLGEPITAEALEAAGWECRRRRFEDDVWWSFPEHDGAGDAYLTVEWDEGGLSAFVGEDASDWNPGFRFKVPGCNTMTQLRALARMVADTEDSAP